jgi:hypothetical protein
VIEIVSRILYLRCGVLWPYGDLSSRVSHLHSFHHEKTFVMISLTRRHGFNVGGKGKTHKTLLQYSLQELLHRLERGK